MTHLVLPLIIASCALFGAALWFVSGIPLAIGATYGVLEFCQSVLVRCVDDLEFFRALFIWLGAGVFSSGIVYGAARAVLRQAKARSALKRLKLFDNGGAVVLIRDSSGKAAFTHGLFRPRIYITTGLISSLSKDELRGVFFHELHHKRQLDPLKFFLFSVLGDSFFYLPALRYWIAGYHLRKESAADDRAAYLSREPLSLAGALVKVAAFNSAAYPAPASITGYENSVGGRIRRLLEGTELPRRRPPARVLAASLLASVVIAAALVLPLQAASTVKQECSIKHCEKHIDTLGEACKTHCDAGRGRHNGHSH